MTLKIFENFLEFLCFFGEKRALRALFSPKNGARLRRAPFFSFLPIFPWGAPAARPFLFFSLFPLGRACGAPIFFIFFSGGGVLGGSWSWVGADFFWAEKTFFSGSCNFEELFEPSQPCCLRVSSHLEPGTTPPPYIDYVRVPGLSRLQKLQNR